MSLITECSNDIHREYPNLFEYETAKYQSSILCLLALEISNLISFIPSSHTIACMHGSMHIHMLEQHTHTHTHTHTLQQNLQAELLIKDGILLFDSLGLLLGLLGGIGQEVELEWP